MKKYLLMLVALFSLALYSCTDKAATDNKAATPGTTETTAEAATDGTLTPTGDPEKDAQACVDLMVKTIEQTDFTNEESQKKLEEVMKSTQETFEKFYEEKGAEAKKAFDEAGKKASEKVDLEGLITKKAMEALETAKGKLGEKK